MGSDLRRDDGGHTGNVGQLPKLSDESQGTSAMARLIEERLRAGLHPTVLEITNESHMHSVKPGSETHFKVRVVSTVFEGLRSVERHRRVNALVAEAFAKGLHALALRTETPAEYETNQAAGDAFASPACLGGSKVDKR